MNDYRKKFKNSDLNFVEEYEFEPYVETNILLKEEAEYLWGKEDKNFDGDEPSKLFGISDSAINNENEIIKDSFSNLEQKIEENSISKNEFKDFQSSMNDTVDKLNEIVYLLKANTLDQKETKKSLMDGIQNMEQYSPLFDPANKTNIVIQQQATLKDEEELLNSFQRVLDLRMDDANSQMRTLLDELEFTKRKFNEILNNYDLTIKNVSERQGELNSYLFDSHSTISNLSNEITNTKKDYLKIEEEISRIYSTWTENNKLLSKLESIIYEIGTAKLGYDQDINLLLDEIKDKTIENKKTIDQLTYDFEMARNKFQNDVGDLEYRVNQELNLVNNKIDDLEDQYENLSILQEDNYLSLRENIRDNQRDIDFLKERDFANIEKFVELESNITKNTQDIDAINEKILELSNMDRIIDHVLGSPLVQKSIEMKISNMITENNNYIGDEFRNKLEVFSTNVITDIDDVRKNNEELITSYQLIENKIHELTNAVNSFDKSAELKSQLEFLENSYKELYEKTAQKIKDNLTILNDQLSSVSINEKEVIDLINSSHELSTIIKDKTRQVIEEKLNEIRVNVESIEFNLEAKIKDFNEKMLAETINDKIIFETSRIKNESLNVIYQELIKRDKMIDLNNEELVKNYETILECNRLLRSLEELVIKQGEEFDGYTFDKSNSMEALIIKISEQKNRISSLEDIVRKNITNFNLYGESETANAMKRGLESWRLEFSADIVEMVKNLVNEEIKKKNMISYVKNSENIENNTVNNFSFFTKNSNDFSTTSDNDFFLRRIKDILGRLEESAMNTISTNDIMLNVSNIVKLEENNEEIVTNNSENIQENK